MAEGVVKSVTDVAQYDNESPGASVADSVTNIIKTTTNTIKYLPQEQHTVNLQL